METTIEKKQAFKALSKICLNNWHYIEHKVLSFSEGINFFTGHSGSGKSTVIDAMQIVLYANTDGRGFFNKAAADDSDRSLIEYLRGMVSIGDNNEENYIRNKNFSTTIVLELEQTATKDKECIGVVFDVETATNHVSRLFFWHKGEIPKNHYRTKERAMATTEVREYIQKNREKEECYFGASNERFRRQLYDIYLGGLDMEKFPRLFKRAIPFKMNIKLEDFVREYICMEQDIQIEDMQESVMQYGRMRQKIEDTMKELERLGEIKESFSVYQNQKEEVQKLHAQYTKLEMMILKQQAMTFQEKITKAQEDKSVQESSKKALELEIEELSLAYDELVKQLANSGYEQWKTKLQGVNELLEQLSRNKVSWEQCCQRLKQWIEVDITPNQTVWDIETFAKGEIDLGQLCRLKHSLKVMREDLEEQRQENASKLRRLKRRKKEVDVELKELKKGNKAYPQALENARYEIQNKLSHQAGELVKVYILADFLDMKSETWHKAVEGYLASNKLALVVEPQYAKDAMGIYREMDPKRLLGVSVLDTEKILTQHISVKEHALSEEVIAKEPYVRSFIDLLLGKVMKCTTVEQLRSVGTGVTPDCLLYKNFRLKGMNVADYTKRSYIGESSVKQRIKDLKSEKLQIIQEEEPLLKVLEETEQMLEMEDLGRTEHEYLELQNSIKRIKEKTEQKAELEDKLLKLQADSVGVLEEKIQKNRRYQTEKRNLLGEVSKEIWNREKQMDDWREAYLRTNEELTQKMWEFKKSQVMDEDLEHDMKEMNQASVENLRNTVFRKIKMTEEAVEEAFRKLVELRAAYLREYPHRTFSATAELNDSYEELMSKLKCDHLEEFKERAREQARSAAEHFKDDFILKIRTAIREAFQRRDELNRIISHLDFGKDKYQFRITKNKGADGVYYQMFMDDSLQIDPSTLDSSMEHQMNLFSLEHENKYGEVMSDLIDIFIPPENATPEELEEAKRNMEKYADYRTYLSFDMEQIVGGEEKLTIGLSRMIKKNSGGEGQNPLYVALLASFAQAYRINLSPKIRRNPTIRLVVLDEAFSKMDAEKVASCIELIRGLGFQAIISATNDKIQNYLENVDKTFVYANPNKKNISVQEFEKLEFEQLMEEPLLVTRNV